MRTVTIEIEGPVMDNLACILISHGLASDMFHVDFADVEEVQGMGTYEVLELVGKNMSATGSDILRAAIDTGNAVTLDGDPVDLDMLREACGLTPVNQPG